MVNLSATYKHDGLKLHFLNNTFIVKHPKICSYTQIPGECSKTLPWDLGALNNSYTNQCQNVNQLPAIGWGSTCRWGDKRHIKTLGPLERHFLPRQKEPSVCGKGMLECLPTNSLFGTCSLAVRISNMRKLSLQLCQRCPVADHLLVECDNHSGHPRTTVLSDQG